MKTLFTALLLALACVTVSAASPTREDLQKAARAIDVLTKAYDASSRLSYDDGIALLKLAELNHELNLTAGPILRDVFDQGVDSDTWLLRHREGVVQCSSKVLQMKAKVALMDDRGAKAAVAGILAGNEEFLAGLRHVQNCYAGSPGNVEDGVAAMRSGINRRKAAGLPIIKKLRELIGSEEFDKGSVKILEETARAASR